MSRKLLLAPTLSYPEEQAHLAKISDRNVPTVYRELVNKTWDYIEKRLDALNWKVEKVYDLGRSYEENLRYMNESLEEGWTTAFIRKRLLDNGAKYVLVGDGDTYLEALAWDRHYKLGLINREFWESVYKDFGKTIGRDIDKDLKDSEIAFFENSPVVVNNIKLPDTIEVELIDPFPQEIKP